MGKQKQRLFREELVVFAFVLLFTLATNAETKISGKEPAVKFTRIIYDVSSLLRDRKYKHHHQILHDIWTNVSSSFYFDTNADLGECQFEVNASAAQRNSFSCASVFSLGGVSVLVDGNAKINDVLNLSSFMRPFRQDDSIENLLGNKTSILKSILVSLAHNHEQQCYCSQQINGLSKFIEAKRAAFTSHGVKIGLELNRHFLNCCENHDEEFGFPDIVEHVVLPIQLTRSSAILSYGLFLDTINKHVEGLAKIIQKFNSNPTFYYKIDMSSDWKHSTGEQVAAKYESLVQQYMTAWIGESQSTGKEIYILHPTTSNFSATENNRFLNEHVTTAINTGQNPIFHTNTCHQQFSECGKILNIMHSTFNKVLLVNPSLSLCLSGYQVANEKLPQSSKDGICGRTSLLFIQDENNPTVANLMNQLMSNTATLNASVVYFDSNYEWESEKVEMLKRMMSENIKIGCYKDVNAQNAVEHNIHIFVDNIAHNCGRLWNMSAHVLLHVSLEIKIESDLMELLSNLHKKKLAIEKKYPNKTATAMIRIVSIISRQNASVNFNLATPFNFLYCDRKLTLMNEYHQAVLTFAKTHQWNELVLIPAIDTIHDFGLWRNVETDGDINRSATNFPLLYRSNAEKLINGKDLPMTYPCIEQTNNTNLHGINFWENPYSGTTFTVKLRENAPLRLEEMQRALLFAFYRFPFVEVRDVNKQQLTQADGLLTPQVLNGIRSVHQLPETGRPLIYFEISLPEDIIIQNEIQNLMAQNYTAVHFSNWENRSKEQLGKAHSIIQTAYKSRSKFGVTVRNCSLEMNMGLTNLLQLPFVFMIDYVICDVKSVLPHNRDRNKMQKYLDNLFYTKSYMEHILSTDKNRVEVMFRINLMSKMTCPEPPRDIFLKFINDVHKHSVAFKIKYFIVPAFETQNLSRKCTKTWWRISDYSDLDNIHVYSDKEKEYFGLPTSSIIISSAEENPTESPLPPATTYDVYLFTILPITALVVGAAVLLFIQRKYYEKSFLTRREVNQFYKSRVMSSDEMPLTDTNPPNSDYINFPASCEISVRDIDVHEEVGKGQFGVVHVGYLKKRVEVAIKIPRADCTKEEFLSTLSELKILCHVGSHPNIVSFLGAHTKNIRSGKLMILIEYCAKGSLESYIRSLSLDCTHDFNQLYQFAHQIASGMEHLSEKRIIHGDLATRNVLLTADFTCKISDFGLSRRLYEVSVYVKRGNEALPWMWMAPESLTDMEFTTKSDVWSYAVTLWEIFSLGKLPYPGRFLTQDFILELESGVRMEKAPLASDAIHQKMLECWSLAQEERPSFTELKQYFSALRNHQYQNVNVI